MTTVFIPMPEWQGLAFLRDRQSAFNRLVNQLGEPILGEVGLINDLAHGLKDRSRAVENGRATHPEGFTILRISFGKLVHGYLQFNRHLKSTEHPQTGAPAYSLSRDGLLYLLQKVDAGEAELLMDEVFAPALPEAPILFGRDESCGPSGLDAQWLPPSQQTDAERDRTAEQGGDLSFGEGPRGPLGWGC